MITNQTEAKTNSEMLARLLLQMIYSARIQTDVGDDDEDVDFVYSVSTTNGGLLSQKTPTLKGNHWEVDVPAIDGGNSTFIKYSLRHFK